MLQLIGILGFVLALVAILYASEVSRRAVAKAAALEDALIRTNRRLHDVEAKLQMQAKREKYEKVMDERHKETLIALEEKSRAKEREPRTAEHFTPSSHHPGHPRRKQA